LRFLYDRHGKKEDVNKKEIINSEENSDNKKVVNLIKPKEERVA
jgi:hypothetical protein